MGAYNVVTVDFAGPDTGQTHALRIQFKYGDKWQHEYRVGDLLRWGGNDEGEKDATHAVVYGIAEDTLPPGLPEDFEVHVIDGRIGQVIPATGRYDFGDDNFLILDEWQTRLRNAYHRVSEIAVGYPGDVAFESVLKQLEYLIALADGVERDDSRLEELTFGLLAVRNLSGDLPNELQSELCEISEVVRLDLRRQGRRMGRPGPAGSSG